MKRKGTIGLDLTYGPSHFLIHVFLVFYRKNTETPKWKGVAGADVSSIYHPNR